MTINSVRKIIFYNTLIFSLSLILVELLFGGWIRDNGIKRLNVISNVSIQYDVSHLYASKPIRYTRDKYGLRGNYISPSDIDILTVGASTTDERYVDDEKTWQKNLQNTFKSENKDLNIANAGLDGSSTYGHLKIFDKWFPKIPGLKPKYILFYVGLADLYVDPGYLYDDLEGSGCGHWEKNSSHSPWAFGTSEFACSWKSAIKAKSALYYLYSTGRGNIRARAVGVYHGTEKTKGYIWVTRGIFKGSYEDLMESRLVEFSKRLIELGKKTRNMGAIPIFVTQQLLRYKSDGQQIIGVKNTQNYDGVQFNGVDTYYMMNLLNSKTMKICEQIQGICIDLAKELIFEDTDAYDLSGHTTPQGSRKIGKYLYSKLKHLF